MSERRGDPRERQERLRSLDRLLLEEFDSAGALGEHDLRSVCSQDAELQRLKLDDGTINEWWSYARRRRLIEVPAAPVLEGEFVLSERGETRLERAIATSPVASSGWEKQALSRIITFVAPSAAGVATIWALAEKNSEIVLIGFGLIGALIAALLVSWTLSAAVLKPLWEKYGLPYAARVNVKWLAGSELRIGFRKLEEVDPKRLPSQPGPPV